MRPKIGLALGAGGLRGLAHIGVLRVLERENIPIDYIAGCSIGSLIGALYCAGLDAETIYKLAKHLKRRHWIDFVIPKMGIISGDRVLAMLRLLTKQKKFEDLSIPLSVIATDLGNGREVVFNEGDVATAVRASVSVPGVFVPYQLGEILYVDGAVLNPTPIDVARKMGSDYVIAVDLAHKGETGTITNLFDVIIQAINIMERQMFNQRQEECDVLLRPKVAHLSPSSFDSIDECVALGEQAAEESLPEIKRILDDSLTEDDLESVENQDRQLEIQD